MKTISDTVISSKGQRTMKRALANLRWQVDNNPDPAVQRIAYAMETAIRWATEKTAGWAEPADEAKLLAKLLHDELKRTDAANGGDTPK